MRKTRLVVLVALCTVATLSGCAAKVLNSSQDNILISATSIEDALKLASGECRKYKGYARFVEIPESDKYRYKCVQ